MQIVKRIIVLMKRNEFLSFLASSIVLWEYTTNEDSPESLQGPFTTEQMVRLTNTEGKLDKDKVRCRRIGTKQYYSIKRIDFDLYLD
jgi:hypothetical protein